MFRTLVNFDDSTKGRLKKVLRYTLIFLSTVFFVTGLDLAAALDPDGAGRNRAYYGSDANGPGYDSSYQPHKRLDGERT